MKWTPRTLVGALALALVAIGLVYVAFRSDPAPVDLVAVERAPMQVTINADGRTRIREIYDVATPITGTALRAPVEVGQTVIAGETVVAVVQPVAPALLDSRSRIQAEAAVREAEAAMHVAQTDLLKTKQDHAYERSQYERAQTLVERGAASITRLEDAAQRLSVAEAALSAASARLDMSKSALARAQAALIEPDMDSDPTGACCLELTSPANGVVLARDIVSERPVAAGARLLSIGDPTDLEIVADLLSSEAVRLVPGARALVERWGGRGALEARLLHVEPSARTKVSALGIEEQRVDAIFALTSPPERRSALGDGFSVFLRIVEWEAEEALQAPLSALFRRGEDWAVFVARDGAAHLRKVELGRRGDRVAEIIDGLSPGEWVVAHPSDALSDGTAIEARQSLQSGS